jgi:hypothetical protein
LNILVLLSLVLVYSNWILNFSAISCKSFNWYLAIDWICSGLIEAILSSVICEASVILAILLITFSFFGFTFLELSSVVSSVFSVRLSSELLVKISLVG